LSASGGGRAMTGSDAASDKAEGIYRHAVAATTSSTAPPSARKLNPAALLHSAPTKRPGPDGGAATRPVPGSVTTCGAGTRWWDGQCKTVPCIPNPRFTPHCQAVDQDKYRSPAGVPGAEQVRHERLRWDRATVVMVTCGAGAQRHVRNP